ncbi:MAG: hypothetical protein LBU57_07750 [Dysgonamonadaceae bacterium]|jgi:hypothetical protein|nr:hypothetical protein [Dysgonamonadaceae bacterium]
MLNRRNRETLKNYFRQGERPTQQAFEELIDSTLNILEDGISGSPPIGIGLAPLTEEGVVISVFRSAGDQKTMWEIAIEKKNGDLQIRHCDDENSQPVLTIKHREDVQHKAQDILINGTLNSPGRKGNYKTGKVPADGKWHDMLGEASRLEEGCWAFEVVAGCGERNKGKYALLVATALHCFGNRPRIRKVRSNFGLFGNKICLRWRKVKDKFACRLQIKTSFRYGEGTMIEYQISRLWDNPAMD